MTISTEDAVSVVQRARDVPESFLTNILGVERVYDKQIEVMESIRDNRRTSVCGCNSSGKDWLSGRIILWWLGTHDEAKVVVIGPTSRQVDEIVWRESRSAFASAKYPLGGRMYDTSKYEISADQTAIGFATDKEYNIQGFHSPHLLVIVTEAHSVPQTHIESIKRLNPERILMTGNALSQSGEFYESFHGLSDVYNSIYISFFDTPNAIEGKTVIPGMMTIEDAAERKREWGEESPLYIASVLGRFPDNSDEAIIPLSWVEAAVERNLTSHKTERKILGVDIARYGDDRTVIYSRHGGVCRKIYDVQGKSLMSTTGVINQFVEEDPLIETIVLDDDGLGGGVTDRLKELRMEGKMRHVKIVPFKNGGSAKEKENFFNAISEAWWRMREAFQNEVVDILENKSFQAQVVSRQYGVHSDRRIRIQPKDEMKRDIGRSPDDADALAMTFSPLIGSTQTRIGTIKRRPIA